MDFVLVDNCRPGRTVYENSEDLMFSLLRLPGDVGLKRISQELKNGADLESCYCGVTFVGAACWLGRYDVIQVVVDFLKEEKQTDISRCSLSCSPSKSRHRTSVLDCYDTMGNTPLLLAISGGHLEICQLLLENGADMNKQHQSSKQTPLLIAIEHNQDEISSYLLDSGVDVQLTDNVGITPLYAAIKAKKLGIVRQLITEECDVDIGSQDHSPIFLATRMGQLDIVKMLVEAGCHRDVSNKYGVTPMSEAAFKGHGDVLEYLLEEKCNAHLVDMYNQSPLHVAVIAGHLDCARKLVEGGVNCKLRNNNGETAMELAMSMRRTDILEYFLLKGIDLLPSSTYYRISKHLAPLVDRGDIAMLCLLIRNCSKLPLLCCPGSVTLLRSNENLLKLYVHSNTQALPDHLMTGRKESDWLTELNNNPRSLKDLCRINIRQTLGNKVLSDVHRLPLPPCVKEYITLAYL